MRRLISGSLLVVTIMGTALISTSSGASAVPTSRSVVGSKTVSLTCPSGDKRTTADASVQPGVIAASLALLPIRYTPNTIDASGRLVPIGSVDTLFTTDQLVAVWQNSTDCSATPGSRNAWVTDSSGRVFNESDNSGPAANNMGDMSGQPLNQPMVGMSPTADAGGYWLVAADGGIFSFGGAPFHGSTGNIHLNQPIVGMAVTPDSGGYWLAAADGGIFAFGDAPFYGSLGNLTLNKPIEAMIATPDGHGYWMVASDGGIFAFGDAAFHGSLGGRTLPAPIAGMVPNGSGYTLIGEDGSLYPFS
jgi:hypothetical protein